MARLHDVDLLGSTLSTLRNNNIGEVNWFLIESYIIHSLFSPTSLLSISLACDVSKQLFSRVQYMRLEAMADFSVQTRLTKAMMAMFWI